MLERWTLSELAALVGVSAATVKSFKKHGLLPPSLGKGRGANYGREHVERLRKIGEYRQLRYSLGAIRAILEGRVDVLPTEGELEAARVRPDGHLEKMERSETRDPLFGDPNRNQTSIAEAWGRVKLFPGLELHYELGRYQVYPRTVEELKEALRAILCADEER
ncbi:MAG: MerR family transcriptional regulator [Phycisphaerae bacterium]